MVLCCICNGQVYSAEECRYHGKVYHYVCFKCTQCKKKLHVSNARSFDKIPYCQQHSPETKRVATTTSTDETINMAESQSNTTNDSDFKINTIEDNSTIAVVMRSSSQNNISTSSQVPLAARKNVLAAGYDKFQSQIELAGQVFTVDPVMRQSIFNMFNEFNIIVCGSPRVGKSTLINAICSGTLAKTGGGLDSCTKDMSRYVLTEKCRVNDEWITYTYNFWDAPAFESWNEADIRNNFNKIIQKPKSDPLCMIYCASPGSFANTKQLKWLLDVCIREHKVFCALVVTNKWAGQKTQRLAILDKYKELLNDYHKRTDEEDGVTYFGNVGLCTMVNAQPYIDEDQGLHHEQEGVDELMEGIMACLNNDGRVFHWCMTMMQKKGLLNNFKGKMKRHSINIQDFLTEKFGK